MLLFIFRLNKTENLFLLLYLYLFSSAQLNAVENCIFAETISDRAKSLLDVSNKGLLTKLY